MVEPPVFTSHVSPPLRPSFPPVTPDNGRLLRIAAAGGKLLAAPYSGVTISFLAYKSSLQPESLHPARGVAPSGFRPL